MNLRVAVTCEVEGVDARSRSESEREQRVEYDGADAKPSDLHMSRMKSRYHGMEVRTDKR